MSLNVAKPEGQTPWLPGLANAVGRISGIAAPYAVAVLLSSYGVTGVFILLGAVSITVAIAIATIGIETKGVSVESLDLLVR